MVVQHNMQAMNANRMLNVTTGQQAKSTEKLSSGYRINRAADDAAGLTISEKMRKQIRGLDQASTNAQDGVSAVQTAEGALTEVHSMLQRMNELAVQSANGTNAQSDRQAIQDEIDQLATEIDRVSETTKFNEIYLLKGDTKTASKASFMKSTYVMAKDLYAKGGTAVLTADQLKEELAKGNKVYTKKVTKQYRTSPFAPRRIVPSVHRLSQQIQQRKTHCRILCRQIMPHTPLSEYRYPSSEPPHSDGLDKPSRDTRSTSFA